MMCDPIYKNLVKQSKQFLLEKLRGIGIDDTGNMIIATPRKSRPNVVGYYSSMSQFRGKLRIVVDPENIHATLVDEFGREPTETELRREIDKTVFHEYGHSMAEVIRFMEQQGDPLNVPDWMAEFNGEEEFAEDFAQHAVDDAAWHVEFWNRFLPRYAQEFTRIFCEPEVEPSANPALSPYPVGP